MPRLDRDSLITGRTRRIHNPKLPMKNAIEGKEEKAFPLSWEYVKENEGIYEASDPIASVAIISDGRGYFAVIFDDSLKICQNEEAMSMERDSYRLLDKKLTLSND